MNGQTAASTRATGSRILCTVKVFTRGLMGDAMTASTRTIRKMDRALFTGLMDASTQEAGI